MIYALIGVFLAGLGVGASVTYKIDQTAILRLENAIDQSNAKGTVLLEATREKVNSAKHEAVKFNRELDDANKSAITTINALDSQLDALRLFASARVKPRCSDALPAGGDPGVSEDAAGDAQFSTELIELIKNKSRECEIVAQYAQGAYKFANSGAGCGIAK
jgi:outer membrane murein-binding lipoprotein Lpp